MGQTRPAQHDQTRVPDLPGERMRHWCVPLGRDSAVIVAVLDRQRLGLVKTVALTGAFIGLALMLGVDFDALDRRGVAMALAAGVGCAVNAVWIARVMRGVDVLVMTFHMTAVACVALVIAATASGGLTAPTTAGGWWGALGVVVFQGVSIPFFYAAIPRIGPERAAMLNNLQPVSSIVIAYILFAETLGGVQMLGGAMVIGGILLMQWRESAVR